MALVASRPFPIGMSVFTLGTLCLLIGLGLWQLQRRIEKHELIAALSERLAAQPMPLPPPSEWSSLTPARDEFRRVTFSASFSNAPGVGVYSVGSALRPDAIGPGTFVFVPAQTADRQRLVIDRGFVPEGKVAEAVPARPVQIVGFIRFPEKSGWLTPAPDIGRRLWFARDHLGMAQAVNWGAIAPFYIDLESPSPPSGLPKPGPLEVGLKDDHLQYAITWFGLALVIATAFVIWLRGRLRSASA